VKTVPNKSESSNYM